VRRRVLLIGLWLLAGGIAVTLAFVAVGQVARGVVEPNVAALSRNAIDHALTATTVRPPRAPAAPGATSASSSVPAPGRGTGTTTWASTPPVTGAGAAGPLPDTPTTRPEAADTAESAPTTDTRPVQVTETTIATSPTTIDSVPPTTSTTAPPDNGDTVTASRGGTLWSHCSGSEKIVFVAAVPMSGYQRTVDIENAGRIEQKFVNGKLSSVIEAECSYGVVHAHVENDD